MPAFGPSKTPPGAKLALKAIAAKKAVAPVVKKKKTKVTAPVQKPINTPAAIPAAPKAPSVKKPALQWTLEGDPTYQAAMASGQSQFNYARSQALADLQNQQTQAAQETRSINETSAEARRRLAGNYASRGMAGGAAGALTMAEAQANARQIAAQTSIKDQIAALNQQYLANYGAAGSDWTGTLVGQKYKTEAAQAAIQAQLAQRGVA